MRESYPYDSISFLGGDFDVIPDDGWAGHVSNTSGATVTATPYVICSSASSIS